MLALCLMLLVTYHALNYVGIIGLGLGFSQLCQHHFEHNRIAKSQAYSASITVNCLCKPQLSESTVIILSNYVSDEPKDKSDEFKN